MTNQLNQGKQRYNNLSLSKYTHITRNEIPRNDEKMNELTVGQESRSQFLFSLFRKIYQPSYLNSSSTKYIQSIIFTQYEFNYRINKNVFSVIETSNQQKSTAPNLI